MTRHLDWMLRVLRSSLSYRTAEAQAAGYQAAHLIERVRAELATQREIRVANDPALAVVDDVAHALDGEP